MLSVAASPVFWLFAIIASGIVTWVGASETRRLPPALRIAVVPLYSLAGLAMGIGAYFHKGAVAIGAIAAFFVLISMLQFVVKAFDSEERRDS